MYGESVIGVVVFFGDGSIFNVKFFKKIAKSASPNNNVWRV